MEKEQTTVGKLKEEVCLPSLVRGFSDLFMTIHSHCCFPCLTVGLLHCGNTRLYRSRSVSPNWL